MAAISSAGTASAGAGGNGTASAQASGANASSLSTSAYGTPVMAELISAAAGNGGAGGSGTASATANEGSAGGLTILAQSSRRAGQVREVEAVSSERQAEPLPRFRYGNFRWRRGHLPPGWAVEIGGNGGLGRKLRHWRQWARKLPFISNASPPTPRAA